MHPHQHCIDLCGEALESVRALIPADLYRDVRYYIYEVDEWGLGLEILIDEISEFGIKIDRDQFRSIHAAMASMGLEEDNRVAYLRDHNIA